MKSKNEIVHVEDEIVTAIVNPAKKAACRILCDRVPHFATANGDV